MAPSGNQKKVGSFGLSTSTNFKEVESFEFFVVRFEIYFMSKILDDILKASIFLSCLDPKSSTLAVNLLHPLEIQKATYEQVSEVHKKHYKSRITPFLAMYIQIINGNVKCHFPFWV